MIAKRVIFEGRVQGVGFRYTTKQVALGFEVVGTVKNLADGTVELCVMGTAEEVSDFIREVSEESEVARFIKSFSVREIEHFDSLSGFRIID